MNLTNGSTPVLRVPFLRSVNLNRVGYRTREEDNSILLRLTAPGIKHRAVMLDGDPGVGKTQFAYSIRDAIEDELKREGINFRVPIYELLVHAWTSNEDFFSQPHIGNISMKNVTNPLEAYQKGIFWQVAEASKNGPVVCLLDEFDKCQQRSEYLTLGFTQTGKVQDSDPMNTGRFVEAKLENVVMIATSNGTRAFHGATLRRFTPFSMDFLAPKVETELLREVTGAPISAITAVVEAVVKVRKSGTSKPSIQEMRDLLIISRVAESATDIAHLAKGYLAKGAGDMLPQDLAQLAQTIFTAFGVERGR